ncbi:MAG: HAMP domain-containing sensor histidine kinase [Mycobacteriales bacterium]
MAQSDVPAADPFTAVLGELRAPIVAIQDHVRTLMARDDGIDVQARQQLLQQTLHHSQRLDTLVDDIVLYLRLLSGPVPLNPEPLRLHDLVEELRERLGEPDRVINQIPVDCSLTIDHSALTGVVRRLLRNALVYGARERSVSVAVRMTDEGGCEITVTDEGFGIPAHGLVRAFEPFVRAVHPAEKRGDGAGLGLTVCRELSKLLGGTVELRPQNPGLTAAILLPRQAPA